MISLSLYRDETCTPRPWSPCLYKAMRSVPHAHDIPVSTQRWDLYPMPMISLSLHPQHIKVLILHHINNYFAVNFFQFGVFCKQCLCLSWAIDCVPHWITQQDLNGIIRGLYLCQQQSVTLASRLKQWTIVTADVRITRFRTGNKAFASFLHREIILYCCTNVSRFFIFLGFPHNPSEEMPNVLKKFTYSTCTLASLQSPEQWAIRVDIINTESNYQVRWNPSMMGKFCWILLR